IDDRLPEDHCTDADRQRGAEAVFALRGDPDGPDAEERVETKHENAAHKPPFLGEDGVREVAVLIGQELELILRTPHITLAEDSAVSDSDLCVVRLPSSAA